MDSVPVAVRIGVVLALASSLAACSGSGSERRAVRVMFDESRTRTVFSAGSVAFTLAHAVDAVEDATCTLDGVAVPSCLTSTTRGEIPFSGLATGAHRFEVEIAKAGASSTKAVHILAVVKPNVVVFGATPAGITAAIAAAESGRTVAVIEPSPWVGGMMSGGLAKTDIGRRGEEIIGGLTAEFFRRVRLAESARGACHGACNGLYDFEPQVAEAVFTQMLAEAQVVVERDTRLLGMSKAGSMLQSISTSRGEVPGEVFVDASYEGDLMATAGVPYAIEREARVIGTTPAEVALQEDHAGVQRYRLPRGNILVDPFVTPGDPTSGTLSYIEPRPARVPSEGESDWRVMAYTYRLCVTDDATNRIAFARPLDYDVSRYEAHGRVAQGRSQAGIDLQSTMFNPARTVLSRDGSHYKHDLNGGSTFSTDMTGADLNQAYIEGDESERSRIRQAYRSYIEGLLYTWQTDPRFEGLNQKVARFGFCADEFRQRGGWPEQLYVRVARRMRGAYVTNENDLMQNGRRPAITDVVGFGAYDIDMHTHHYMAAPVDWPDGTRRDAITLEGFQIVPLPEDRPYPVAYRALTPLPQDATNLLNPVTLSATYAAYSSLRMEPTLMILGESAGIAASLALEQGIAVQAIQYLELRRRLLARGQRLNH